MVVGFQGVAEVGLVVGGEGGVGEDLVDKVEVDQLEITKARAKQWN